MNLWIIDVNTPNNNNGFTVTAIRTRTCGATTDARKLRLSLCDHYKHYNTVCVFKLYFIVTNEFLPHLYKYSYPTTHNTKRQYSQSLQQHHYKTY